MKRNAIRILLVDDHPVLRAGLANLLEFESDFEVVGQASNGEAALRMCRETRPDICLVDLSMPGIGGIETLRQLRSSGGAGQAIVLTSSESAQDARLALEAGAAGYLTKTVDHEEIVAAIRAAHRGVTGICRGVSRPAPAAEERDATPRLTPRELEVLHLLRKGGSNAAIGRTLGISERTAKFHVIAILEKLDAPDRTAAVARAFDLGILRVSSPDSPPSSAISPH